MGRSRPVGGRASCRRRGHLNFAADHPSRFCAGAREHRRHAVVCSTRPSAVPQHSAATNGAGLSTPGRGIGGRGRGRMAHLRRLAPQLVSPTPIRPHSPAGSPCRLTGSHPACVCVLHRRGAVRQFLDVLSTLTRSCGWQGTGRHPAPEECRAVPRCWGECGWS